MPGFDYGETYSPIVDAITLRFLVSLIISNKQQIRRMDVVITYLYGSLDAYMYMEVPDGLKLPENHIMGEVLSKKLKTHYMG